MSNSLTPQAATPGTALIPFTEMERRADYIVQGNLFGAKNKAQAVSLMMLAEAEGIHPMKAVQEYDIIQGKPVLKANAVLSRFQAAGGKIKYIRSNSEACEIEFTHPQAGTLTVKWDIARATKAGLTQKDTWQKSPDQMLRARCSSEGVRALFPACLNGCYCKEEIEDCSNEAPKEPQKADAELVQDTPAQKPAEPQKAEAATQETAANFAVNIDGQGQVTQPTKAAIAMPKAVQNSLYNAIVSLTKMDQAKTEAVVKDFCRGLADIYSLSRQQVWQMMERMAFAFPDFEVPNVWPDDEEVFA